MSSRNAYLSAEERKRALGISQALSAIAQRVSRGTNTAAELRSEFRAQLRSVVDDIEYAEVADPDTLVAIPDDLIAMPRTLLVTACRVGNTRLIDNVVTTEDVISW